VHANASRIPNCKFRAFQARKSTLRNCGKPYHVGARAPGGKRARFACGGPPPIADKATIDLANLRSHAQHMTSNLGAYLVYLGMDIATSSVKAVLVDGAGALVDPASAPSAH